MDYRSSQNGFGICYLPQHTRGAFMKAILLIAMLILFIFSSLSNDFWGGIETFVVNQRGRLCCAGRLFRVPKLIYEHGLY